VQIADQNHAARTELGGQDAVPASSHRACSQVLAKKEVFTTPLTAAAWKTKPSWGIVAGNDQIINPDLERFYYERAKAPFIVIEGASHSVYESHPARVAEVIAEAARKVEEKAP
jgi:pimeloyl-ACP methyl ester carboxylesterase